jgi:Predicted AAA-ATPase/Repeats of unknown function (DUF5649)
VSGRTDNLTISTTKGGETNFGVTTIEGNLVVTGTGEVQQTGAISVAGTTEINAARNNITLDNRGNDFQSTLNVAGKDVTIVDVNSVELGNVTTTGRFDDYLYIDKTEIACSLIDRFKYVFLSRPRRFGKSLFLDTLKNIFEGKGSCSGGC